MPEKTRSAQEAEAAGLGVVAVAVGAVVVEGVGVAPSCAPVERQPAVTKRRATRPAVRRSGDGAFTE